MKLITALKEAHIDKEIITINFVADCMKRYLDNPVMTAHKEIPPDDFAIEMRKAGIQGYSQEMYYLIDKLLDNSVKLNPEMITDAIQEYQKISGKHNEQMIRKVGKVLLKYLK